jgi:Na+/H+-dicarboxylate symporter/ABC-type amino acid transport substrate-binding protein
MKLSLSTQILLGVLLGTATGLFLGEYAAALSIIGEAFVGLLQMTVLPYIAIAIISNLGRLSPDVGKRFGGYVGLFLLLSTAITLSAIVLVPMCLPERETASFFSTSILNEPAQIDFVQLFIPANPFHSLANNIVPAVVLFCIAVGTAVMTLKNKTSILGHLDFLTTALARVNGYLVKLTPVGVFAIVASISGTMHPEDLISLKAYVIINTVVSLVLGYGVLMVLLSALTPFSYGDLFRASRAPVLTAFVTGKVFIVLPMLIESAEELFSQHFSEPDEPISNVRAITPLVYPFPHAGKLLALSFIPFAAWFVDIRLALDQYPVFLGAGLVSLFGSPIVAMPFLLDILKLPADMFQLFLASGLLVSRLGDFLGAIHLLFVSILSATALSRKLQVNMRSLLIALGFIIILAAVAIVSTRAYLTGSLSQEYDKDKIIGNMHSALHFVPATVHRFAPVELSPLEQPVMERIARKGVLRIGYNPDNLPMSFFNRAGELVGHDIDMAHLLAQQLGCQLEFVPFEFSTFAEQLQSGQFDIAMSGIAMLPTRLTQVIFSEPYMLITAALVVRDHRRDEFVKRIEEGDFAGIRVANARSSDVVTIAATLLPGAEPVSVPSIRAFCESNVEEADCMIWGAESGSAWTLLHPEFTVVPIRPIYQLPVGYAVSPDNGELADFISRWLMVTKTGPADERLYDHWILGKNSQKQEPRWSIMRNVLHWVE